MGEVFQLSLADGTGIQRAAKAVEKEFKEECVSLKHTHRYLDINISKINLPQSSPMDLLNGDRHLALCWCIRLYTGQVL